MIKFFRKLRQKLLQQNRVSKYLIYAFGEIILVVIGIMIALQVNNWNEERTSKNEAKDYLKNLKTELEQNIILIDQHYKIINIMAKISNNYHSKLVDNTRVIPDSIISNFILYINPIKVLQPSQTVLIDYVNSGYLKELNDAELKKSILLLKSRYESFSYDLMRVKKKYEDDIEPYLLEFGDYTEFLDSIGPYKVAKTDFGHKREAFLNNKIISNKLIWYTGHLYYTGINIKNTSDKLETLSNKIEQYLYHD